MSEGPKARKYPRVGLGGDSAIWSEVWQGRDRPVDAHPRGRHGAGRRRRFSGSESESFDVGSLVGLRFSLPGTAEEIVCGGVVKDNVPGRGIGVEFTQLAPIDRERLRAVAWSSGLAAARPPTLHLYS